MRAKPVKRRQLATQSEDHRQRNIIIGTVAGLVVIGLGVLLYLSIQEPQALDGLRRFAGLSRGHDENVVYEGQDLPPVGGLHSGVWQNCGIYDEPIEAKNGVHSMEHGAVWITYHPDLPAGDVETLQNTVRDESFVVMSPYPGLKSPVVLTAWGIQLEVDSVDDDRIINFVDLYQQGPQTPELGATCSDGTGTPLF